MRKSELVRSLAEKSGLTQGEVEKVIDAMEPVITENCLKNGEEILFPFGKFIRRVNKAREGVNPLTGQKISIKESHSLAFKAKKSTKIVVDKENKKVSKKK